MNYGESGSEILRRAWTAIGTALMGFALIMTVGTIGYKSFGGAGMSWIDALYMTFLMVATIGYGAGLEIFHKPEHEIFTMAVAFSGIGVMTYFFSSVTALVLASDFDTAMRRRRMEKHIRKVRGHYILCGYGRVGRNVAQELETTHRHYIAIDENREMLEAHAEKKPSLLYLHGDDAEDDMLLEANIEQAAGVFAITGDDSRNLMITFTAKQIAPQVRIVARCNEVHNTEKMRRAGADAIISPSFTGGMRIASAMIRPHVVSFLDEMLRTEHSLRVEEVPIPHDFTPRALGTLKLRSADYVLLAVRTGPDWVFNPTKEFMLQPGYIVVAMASPHGRKELEAALLPPDDEATA